MQLTEYEIISMLSESPAAGCACPSLADLVVQSRSRLTHTAARLEKRGWVRRESCLDDRRGVELVLTDAGLGRPSRTWRGCTSPASAQHCSTT